MSKSSTGSKLGWVFTILAAAVFCMSASMKFMGGAQTLDMMGHLGWQQSALVPLAILETFCVLLYLIPKVSVLGAIILTGFLGGAVATHLRIGEAVYMHVVIGLFIWGGLYLREPRLREILPFRK